jgi:hypothetical protein
MCAHVDYIQYRGGHDKGPRQARNIFDSSNNRVSSEEVKQGIRDVENQSLQRNPVIAHKLILSPGLNAVNLQDYTREIMEKLGSEKGLDLKWYAVKHENTENNHAHVVVLGRDLNGVEVSFGRRDLDRMRDLGDRYIEREHQLERYLQRETDRVLLNRDYDRQGDLEFQKLVGEVYRKREPEQDKEKGREGDLEESSREQGQGKGHEDAAPGGKKRKYREWSKDKAIEKLSEDEKIVANGKTYSRYSSTEELEKLDEYLKEDHSHYLPKEQYGLIGTWKMTKQLRGEDFYDKQARYKHDKKYNKGFDKEGNAIRDIDEHRLLDKELRRTFNSSDNRHQKMGRQEYKYVSQGRLTEEHIHYNSIQNISRLEMLKEKFPDRAEEFDAEIASVRKYDSEQWREGKGWESFDELVNGKPAERAKGRRQSEQDKQSEQEKDTKDPTKDSENDRSDTEKTPKELERLERLERAEGEKLEPGQNKETEKTAPQRDSSSQAEARNSMDAHGRVEGIQQDQRQGDKEQDRGDDDSDIGRGR